MFKIKMVLLACCALALDCNAGGDTETSTQRSSVAEAKNDRIATEQQATQEELENKFIDQQEAAAKRDKIKSAFFLLDRYVYENHDIPCCFFWQQSGIYLPRDNPIIAEFKTALYKYNKAAFYSNSLSMERFIQIELEQIDSAIQYAENNPDKIEELRELLIKSNAAVNAYRNKFKEAVEQEKLCDARGCPVILYTLESNKFQCKEGGASNTYSYEGLNQKSKKYYDQYLTPLHEEYVKFEWPLVLLGRAQQKHEFFELWRVHGNDKDVPALRAKIKEYKQQLAQIASLKKVLGEALIKLKNDLLEKIK